MSFVRKHLEPTEISIVIASTAADMAAGMDIRRRVFIEEQAVPESLEFDTDDATAIHFLLRCNNVAAGTCRIRFLDDAAKIERVAFLPTFRNQGLGRQLMLAAIAYLQEKSQPLAMLSAQLQAISFYEKLGFRPTGEPAFEEAGIMHKHMILHIKW